MCHPGTCHRQEPGIRKGLGSRKSVKSENYDFLGPFQIPNKIALRFLRGDTRDFGLLRFTLLWYNSMNDEKM